MSKRDSYIGGNTVVGPGRGWFSKDKKNTKVAKRKFTKKKGKNDARSRVRKKRGEERIKAEFEAFVEEVQHKRMQEG